MSVPGTARYTPLGGRAASAMLAAATARSRASGAAGSESKEKAGDDAGAAPADGGPERSSASRHHSRHHHKHDKEVAPGYTLDQVAALITRVVQQKVGKDSDMCRHTFQLFGRPKEGITVDVFRRQLHTVFGVRLGPEDAARLFRRYDREGTGRVSITDFVRAVVPPDFTEKAWNIKRDEEEDSKARTHSPDKARTLKALPRSLAKYKPTVEDVERQLREKIVEHTRRACDQYREAYQLFGAPGGGISRSEFRKHLENLGIVCDDDVFEQLFMRYDTDGSGLITFAELVASVMPKDYPVRPWNVVEDQIRSVEEKKAVVDLRKSYETDAPAEFEREMSLATLETQLQEKLLAHTKRASSQYREAFALFGSPKDGISKAVFRRTVLGVGIAVSDRAIDQFYEKYNRDHSGLLSFNDLVTGVMPRDYTGTTWNMIRDAELEREELEKKGAPPVLRSWPAAMSKWTIEQVEKVLREKIVARTKRANDQYREAYSLFGCPSGGISKAMLREKCANMGLVLDDRMVSMLFSRYDTDGSGLISFTELVNGIMPKDYSEPAWSVVRDQEQWEQEQRKKEAFLATMPYASRPRLSRPASVAGSRAGGSVRGSARGDTLGLSISGLGGVGMRSSDRLSAAGAAAAIGSPK